MPDQLLFFIDYLENAFSRLSLALPQRSPFEATDSVGEEPMPSQR